MRSAVDVVIIAYLGDPTLVLAHPPHSLGRLGKVVQAAGIAIPSRPRACLTVTRIDREA